MCWVLMVGKHSRVESSTEVQIALRSWQSCCQPSRLRQSAALAIAEGSEEFLSEIPLRSLPPKKNGCHFFPL